MQQLNMHLIDARYAGQCPECGRRIYPGDIIGRTADGQWVCARCVRAVLGHRLGQPDEGHGERSINEFVFQELYFDRRMRRAAGLDELAYFVVESGETQHWTGEPHEPDALWELTSRYAAEGSSVIAIYLPCGDGGYFRIDRLPSLVDDEL